MEDEIFIEIMSKVTKAGMWYAIKDDGRLGYRGAPGISAHLTAIVCVPFCLTLTIPHPTNTIDRFRCRLVISLTAYLHEEMGNRVANE